MNADPRYLKLRELVSSVAFDEPMSRHTSLRLGGPADAFVEPNSVAELCAVLRFAKSKGAPLTVIGRGTNLLIRDGGVRGIVVRLGKAFDYVRIAGTLVTVGAATYMPALVRRTMEAGLTGFEFACGIPGTVGGGVWGNAGAAGGETGDRMVSALCVTREGEIVALSKERLGFGYRHSEVGERVVVEATFHLQHTADPEASRQLVHQLLARRRETQPLAESNAGCMFKNPPDIPAGKLIDELGCKGMRVGDAEVSTKHANFLINRGKATSAQALALIRQLQQLAWEERKIRLETEVRIIGE